MGACTLPTIVDEAPQPDPGGPELKLVAFDDPESDFITTDVYDVDDEIVNFDSEAKSIIWAADGMVFDEGIWTVEGNLLGEGGFFQVRFGNKDGVRRAFFTETGPETICDIESADGLIRINSTDVRVPL